MSEPHDSQSIARRRHPIRHRFEYLAVVAVRTVARVLPRSWVIYFADGASRLFHRLDRRRRTIALANVRAAFPSRSEEACGSIVRGAFTHLGRHVFDLLRFDTMSGEQMQWAFENLKIDAARIKELGAEGLVPEVSMSCFDHEGGGRVRFKQWDGKNWKMITGWIDSDVGLVREMVEESAAKYAKDKKIQIRDCPPSGRFAS